jgi:hypothetical protein
MTPWPFLFLLFFGDNVYGMLRPLFQKENKKRKKKNITMAMIPLRHTESGPCLASSSTFAATNPESKGILSTTFSATKTTPVEGTCAPW